MDKYIVVSSDGWYAKNILQQLPSYQGIDRFPWPLSKEDLKEIKNLPDEEKNYAEQCIKEMGEINIIDMYCGDFVYTYQYAKLCNLLGINADMFICKICDNTVIENQLLVVDNKEYLFVGYDYVLKNAGYSCLIHEKHLCDKIEEIKLNRNGLLNNFEDAKKFAEVRELAKKKNDEMGFELGSDGEDFYIIALFKSVGNLL